jgi:gliding-associated putative ABC transporter substrate-binding component GldG
MKNNVVHIALLILGLFLLNFVSEKLNFRVDLTGDKRFTLSEITKNTVTNLQEPMQIKVYLEGDFPSEFKRIQIETKNLLEQLHNLNQKISYRFVNPQGLERNLINKGMQPSRLTIQEGVKTSEIIIFPYAEIQYKGKSEIVPLLINKRFENQEAQLQASIENLEYAFTDALYKISKQNRKNIAVITGNDQLDFIFLDGLLKTVSKYHHLEPFPLDSANVVPNKTLQLLNKFDLAIIAKPRKEFSENQKLCIDQFLINGGKTLWTIDKVVAEQDSLMHSGTMLATNRELNLTDLFFQYGARIKYNLVKDLYSATIKLADGNIAGQVQYKDYLWYYYPLVVSKNNHPINKNISDVLLRYTSTIDLLKNEIKKTVLLKSSPLSKELGTPRLISLNEVAQKPKPTDFNKGNLNLGVLLEGEFTSAYAGRTLPFKAKDFKKQGVFSKMILIADGDVIKNEVAKGEPLDLGIDKWTGQKYGNKEFLINAIDYLLDDTGLMQLRNKKLKIAFLDKEKIYQNRLFWQVFNVFIPLFILVIFGVVFSIYRKKRYQ